MRQSTNFAVRVPFCDGSDIVYVLLGSPDVSMTGVAANKGGERYVEVSFDDYEPAFFRCKPRTSTYLVEESEIFFYEEGGS